MTTLQQKGVLGDIRSALRDAVYQGGPAPAQQPYGAPPQHYQQAPQQYGAPPAQHYQHAPQPQYQPPPQAAPQYGAPQQHYQQQAPAAASRYYQQQAQAPQRRAPHAPASSPDQYALAPIQQPRAAVASPGPRVSSPSSQIVALSSAPDIFREEHIETRAASKNPDSRVVPMDLSVDARAVLELLPSATCLLFATKCDTVVV